MDTSTDTTAAQSSTTDATKADSVNQDGKRPLSEAEIELNERAAGAGSGQGGSGAAPGSTAAPVPPLARDELHVIANPLDHAILTADTIAQTGATVADVMSAAMDVNGQPAPTSPQEQQLQALHLRVSELNAVVDQLKPLAELVVPGAAPIVTRLTMVESAVSDLMLLAEKTAPLWTRIHNLLNTHFNGKV